MSWPPGVAGLCSGTLHCNIPMSCADCSLTWEEEKPFPVSLLFASCNDMLFQAIFPALTPKTVPRESFCEASLTIPRLVVSDILPALSTATGWQTNACHPPSPNLSRTSSRQRPHVITLHASSSSPLIHHPISWLWWLMSTYTPSTQGAEAGG